SGSPGSRSRAIRTPASGRTRPSSRAVGHGHVVLGAAVVGGDGVAALHLYRLDAAVVDVRDEGRVRPLAGVLIALDRLPGEPEHKAENDDQCEIEQAGAGEAAQLGSPRGLMGDF